MSEIMAISAFIPNEPQIFAILGLQAQKSHCTVFSSRNGLLFVGTSPEWGMDLLDKTIATVSVFAK